MLPFNSSYVLARARKALAELTTKARTYASQLGAQVQTLAQELPLDRLASLPALGLWLPQKSQRYVAIGLVVLLHVVVIWTFATSLRFVRFGDEIRETQVDLVSPNFGGSDADRPLITPVLAQPESVLVPAPQVEIEQTPRPPSTVTAVDMSQVLPPRPDPTHLNLPPNLPAGYKRLGSAVSAVVRVLVLADGSISYAQITHSTGDDSLDAIALAYVKDHWRFIAASARGRPVPDWTTVLVPFKAA